MGTLSGKVGANKRPTLPTVCVSLSSYCNFTSWQLLVPKILARDAPTFKSIFKRQKFTDLLTPVAIDASVLNIIALSLQGGMNFKRKYFNTFWPNSIFTCFLNTQHPHAILSIQYI